MSDTWPLIVIALGCLTILLIAEWVRGWWGGSTSDWETECPKREDKTHCNCWYDGLACCACGAAADEAMLAIIKEDENDL